jgi:hypothetical protein
VVVSEAANRFCTSIGNTTRGYCTLSTPYGGMLNGNTDNYTYCDQTNIVSSPNVDDCRWKSQNVAVTHNVFALTQVDVPNCDHSAGRMCGYNAIISYSGATTLGTCAPDNCNAFTASPYSGTVVEDAIMFDQNNTFTDNTYSGWWCFDPHSQGSSVTWDVWTVAQGTPGSEDTAHPAGLDAGSTYDTPNGSC